MAYAKKTMTYTLAGIAALAFVLIGDWADEYRDGLIYGITAGFIFTGLGGVIASLHLMRHPQKARQIELAKTEERTQLIRMKVRSVLFQVMLYAECAGTLVAGLMGYKEASMTLAALLVVQVVFLIGLYSYYSHKY